LTWKYQNLKFSNDRFDKRSKGNVVIVKCTRCGKYQWYLPKAKFVKRRRKVCVFCGSRFEVNGRSIVKVGLAAREAQLLIAHLNSKGKDMIKILTSLRGQNKDHQRTINAGTIRTIRTLDVDKSQVDKADENNNLDFCHSRSDRNRTIYKAHSMACDVIDKCKVEYYDSDRVKVTLYLPSKFWEQVKGFVESSGLYPSTCFYFFTWGKIGYLTHNGVGNLCNFSKKVTQVIESVSNSVEIFYGVDKARRNVLDKRLRELSRRLERVEAHLKNSQECLNALPTLISLLERQISILETVGDKFS